MRSPYLHFCWRAAARQNFWLAVSLAVAAQCALLDSRPLPNLCSFVLFAVELALLFQSRRTGNVRSLFWLPLLFVLWANLHLQFTYGLFVLGLLFADAFVEEICRRSGLIWFDSTDAPALPLGTLGAVAALSVFATLLSPYSYHIYEAVLQNATAVAYIAEHHAMNFRHPQHYILLLLAMAAFLTLGRRRSRDLFKIGLMIVSVVVGFRMQADAGFLALAAVAVIGDSFSIEKPETEREIASALENGRHW